MDFSGAPPTNLQWIDDATYLQSRRTGGGIEWLKVDAASGSTSSLFDLARMEAALARLPDITPERASGLARSGDLIFNPSRTGTLVTIADDLYFYDFASAAATRLTDTAGSEEEAGFSPDGRLVAFVRGNNLHVVDVSARQERALTTDGGPQLLNGKLDWLYQEEIYGRGRFRGYWWSPDSSRLAFLQLDERPVPEYTVVDDIPYRPNVEVTDYPKAGDANPLVRLGIAHVTGSSPVWVEQGSYVATDMLIVDVDWAPGTAGLTYQVQNREQTWLDLNVAEAASGRSRRLLRETTAAWVNVNGSPIWLKDGSFLWFSERSGFKHLYHYRDGTLVRPVTTGRWDVRSLYGVDEARGLLYFAAGARRHIDTDVYRIGLDGAALTRLSRTDGTHRANFNPSYTQYIGTWSDATTPTQVRLHRADGSEVRVINANVVKSLAEYRLSRPEFVEVRTRDGFVMDGMLIRPPDFNPSRRYPVYQLTYAGPGTASVRNQWGGSQVHVPPAHRAAGDRGLGARQSELGRQGSRVTMARVRQTWRARASRPRRRGRLAEAAALRGSVADRPARMELRRVHDRVRLDAQHELGGRYRRGTCHRLAELRYGVHRTVHEDAAQQPRRVSSHGTAFRGSESSRTDAAHPWRHRRQRAQTELRAVRVRAATRRQDV